MSTLTLYFLYKVQVAMTTLTKKLIFGPITIMHLFFLIELQLLEPFKEFTT